MPKRKCDVEKEFSPDELHEHWGNGKPISYKCKKYLVGKMSYGDYFLEPFDSKYPLGRGETQPMHRDTLWLERRQKKNQYEINQFIYEVEK